MKMECPNCPPSKYLLRKLDSGYYQCGRCKEVFLPINIEDYVKIIRQIKNLIVEEHIDSKGRKIIIHGGFEHIAKNECELCELLKIIGG